MLQICKISTFSSGYCLVILAATLAAFVHVAAKPLLEIDSNSFEINPIVMAFLIYLVCGLFFTPLARNTKSVYKIKRKHIFIMMLIGLAEVSALITYFFGLKDSTAINASIFSNGEIIFSLIIAMIVFKEKLHLRESIPFSMIIIGMIIIPIGNNLYQNDMNINSLVMGDMLIILSGFLYAIDITLCKYVGDRFNSKRISQIVSFFCALFAFIIAIIFQIPIEIDFTQIPQIMFIAILGTGLSALFFLMGLKILGSVRTVLLYSTTSIFGVIFSTLFLSEIVTYVDILSIGIVLVGIFLLRNKLSEGESNTQQSQENKKGIIEKPVGIL
jgi:drug/metabolite transporter (DMT)-like permease